MKLKDYAFNGYCGIQLCFDWGFNGYPQNMCIDFLNERDMEILDDERFDSFCQVEDCPFNDSVEIEMTGRLIDFTTGTRFEAEDMDKIITWFVNENENVYIGIIDW